MIEALAIGIVAYSESCRTEPCRLDIDLAVATGCSRIAIRILLRSEAALWSV